MRCSIFGAVCCLTCRGRRLLSTTPAIPPRSNRRSHSYPVGREISNSAHSSCIVCSPPLACNTNRIRCSSTFTLPHAILGPPGGPPPFHRPAPSVKDVLRPPCKGCFETEHWKPAPLRFAIRRKYSWTIEFEVSSG